VDGLGDRTEPGHADPQALAGGWAWGCHRDGV